MIIGMVCNAQHGGLEWCYIVSLRLITQLRSLNIQVKATDPLYSISEIDNIFGMGTGIEWNENLLSEFKNLIIVTDHVEFKG